MLRTDDSRARHQRIQAAIGQKLEFEPRRRPDIQFIFAPSQPRTARLLRPQLRFHLAGDIPTYTLGDAYEPHPTANQEIDGIMFPDMPWMLGDEDSVRRSARGGARGFRRAAGTPRPAVRVRLRRVSHRDVLQRGAPISPQGLTGTLSIDAQGRVRRELDWVRIKSGAPTPLERGDTAAANTATSAHDTSGTAFASLRRDQAHGSPPDRLAAPRTPPRRFSSRRASRSSRAISCAASASSTSWRAQGDLLVVAEVRTRASDAFGGAAASIGRGKQRRIAATAALFLQRHASCARCRVRFDVLVVRDGSVEWLKHAFDA